jgi:putative hydrolase of the HAD superfamily
MQIDAVILDYGYVLSLPPHEEDFDALRQASGIAAANFRDLYWRHRDAYDRDIFDGPTYWKELAADAGANFSPELIQKLIALDCQLWAHPHPIMVDWARSLHLHGLRTAVLSNMPRPVGNCLRRTAKWLELFNHLCFSGELKMGKPDPAIFRACLEALRVPAEQSLFIDDREVNVQAARALGMHAVVFHSVEQLPKALEPFGLVASLAEAALRRS